MSKCNLEIELDHENRRVQAGETVKGRVSVVVNKDVRCKGLNVSLRWRTLGSGNTNSGVSAEQVLFEGEWQAGEILVYRFELPAPSAPLSFYGQHVSVANFVHVTADIPWALDPKAEQDYLLVPGPEAPSLDDLPSPGKEEFHHKAKNTVGLTISTLLMVAAGACVVFNYWIAAAIFGALFLLIGGLTFRKLRRDEKTGPIEGSFRPLAVSPGGQLQFELRFRPKSDVHLEGVFLEFTGAEAAESGSGSNVTHYSHTISSSEQAVCEDRICMADEPVELKDFIEVPQTELYSFSASDNRIVWTVTAKLKIQGTANWSVSRNLTVFPGL